VVPIEFELLPDRDRATGCSAYDERSRRGGRKPDPVNTRRDSHREPPSTVPGRSPTDRDVRTRDRTDGIDFQTLRVVNPSSRRFDTERIGYRVKTVLVSSRPRFRLCGNTSV